MPPLGRCGGYELLRWIDAGGMGEIFLARPRSGDPYVAVKRLAPHMAQDETFVAMFLDEARLAPLLKHPNICRVYELGQQGASYFLAMEWVDGVSLKLLLSRARSQYGNLPIPLASWIITRIAEGLDYAHRLTDGAGTPYCIVHRDVSPKNIMIGYDGSVKLLDFGLAKARTQLHRTQPGHVKGKFGYLAPEQISGEVDARTDVFALGLCLYEALCGEQLFDHRTAAETVRAVSLYERPPSVRDKRSEVPAELDAVVQRALARDPAQRFQSAAGLKLAVERLLRKKRQTPNAEQVSAYIRTLFAGYDNPPDGRSPDPARPAPSSVPPPVWSEAPPDVGRVGAAGGGNPLAAAGEERRARSRRRLRLVWLALGAVAVTGTLALAVIVVMLLARFS